MLTLSRWISYYFWLVFFSAPLLVRAAILPDCDPLLKGSDTPPRPGFDHFCGVDDLFALLINIYNFLLGLAGLVALLMLIWGGVKMLIAYLGLFDSPEADLESAKKTVSQAIFGFVLIAMAYLIVNTLLTLLGFDTNSAVNTLLRKYFQ